MTIGNVDLVNGLMGSAMQPGQVQGVQNENKIDFKSVFSENAKVDTKSNVSDIVPEKKEVDLKAANSKMDNSSPKINDKKAEAEPKEEKVAEVKDELIKEVAKEFKISEDELVDAMTALGFTVADLLDPSNVMQIMMQLNESDNPLEIITDANLSEMFKNVNETVSQIVGEATKELGITDEELKGLLDEVDNSNENDFSVDLTNETVAPKVEVEDKDNNTKDSSEKKESDNKSAEKPVHTDNNVLTRLDETVREAFEVTENVDVVPVDVDDVIRQINEAVRVQMTPDSTSMELTLNPENLGKVNIQVVAKNGVITATIEATDEVVKKALETQMISLKDNLNNQGIKVEAVEITIASRSFEGQQDSEASNNSGNQGNRRNGNRSISLDDEVTENVEEPEIGNTDSTVSYRA